MNIFKIASQDVVDNSWKIPIVPFPATLNKIIQSVPGHLLFRIRLLPTIRYFITAWRDHAAYGSTSAINVMYNILKTMIRHLSHSMDARPAYVIVFDGILTRNCNATQPP